MLIEIKAGQFRKVSRLVRRECCNCMDGNCLLLDDGETHTCVQLISKYHIFCNHFKDAVLPLDKELYRELICDNDYKRCQSCGSRFYSKARNKRYCDKCADRIKRQKAAERKRRQRSGKENQMNDNAKVFSLIEMREMMIDTSDYQMMEEVGEFTGTLEMKAQGHKKSIRIFLTLDDGRKIITPIFWWQTYLGFYYMPIGTKLRLFYSESNQNKVYLEKIEIIENV